MQALFLPGKGLAASGQGQGQRRACAWKASFALLRRGGATVSEVMTRRKPQGLLVCLVCPQPTLLHTLNTYSVLGTTRNWCRGPGFRFVLTLPARHGLPTDAPARASLEDPAARGPNIPNFPTHQPRRAQPNHRRSHANEAQEERGHNQAVGINRGLNPRRHWVRREGIEGVGRKHRAQGGGVSLIDLCSLLIHSNISPPLPQTHTHTQRGHPCAKQQRRKHGPAPTPTSARADLAIAALDPDRHAPRARKDLQQHHHQQPLNGPSEMRTTSPPPSHPSANRWPLPRSLPLALP